jgi:hypothetical protein
MKHWGVGIVIRYKCIEKYTYDNEFEEINISEKDLNWLLYGNENEQIISKLLNEENKFKEYINLVGEAFRAEHLIIALNIIKIAYKDKNKILEAKIIQYIPTKEQIERICYLVDKYHISEFVNNYLDEKRIIDQKILNLKIGIIKGSLIFYNIDLIEISNQKIKDMVIGKNYILYSQILSEFGYNASVGEYKYLINKLMKE